MHGHGMLWMWTERYCTDTDILCDNCQALRVTVRLELPPSRDSEPASLVVLRLGHFAYAGESVIPTCMQSLQCCFGCPDEIL